MKSSSRLVMLVVDDSHMIRNVISDLYADDVFEVHTAKNATEALENVKLLRPSVITMDLTMPSLDGNDTEAGVACIEKIIKLDPNANIIVVSALSDQRVNLKALSRGARAFVKKPLDQVLLKEVIDKVVKELT